MTSTRVTFIADANHHGKLAVNKLHLNSDGRQNKRLSQLIAHYSSFQTKTQSMTNQTSPAPDIIKITEVFLIPSSFLVAALGTADTNLHRAAVSFLGFIISVLWWFCFREALLELNASVIEPTKVIPPTRIRILGWLPLIFAIGWSISLLGHATLWNQPLGTNLIHE